MTLHSPRLPHPAPNTNIGIAMTRILPLSLLLAVALIACNDGRSPADTTAEAATPAAPGPAAPDPEVPAPAAPAPDTALARYDGYGDMRFGMTADEAKQAWGGELKGVPGEGEVCYYLTPVSSPVPSYFAFMVENGKFVRYDVGNDKEVAPGGGKRGMTAEEIRALYPGIVESAHKYVEGGKYLKVAANDGSAGKLVFATDAAGKVTEWHAGIEPQVDYIEGCA
jgi:hypothetical protein